MLRAHGGHASAERAALRIDAADATLVASLEDNLPNTALESLACGTPVIGFASGGIPEVVQPGVTGMLASAGDSEGLQRAICDVLANPALAAKMSVGSRAIALRDFSLPVQAARYHELYQEALEESRA